MHWWHALHFILWNRADLITPQLEFYDSIYNSAQNTAEFQGYEGVRWPKMIGPEGRESPSSIGVFLIWQQPHIIYLCELLRETSPDSAVILEKYSNLVFATADFIASYARWDSTGGRYVLGPALIPAQERFHAETTINPAFELAYWHWGLKTAIQWRKFMGLPDNHQWNEVLANLSDLVIADSLYLFTENATDSYSNPAYLTDHPMVLGALGMLPPSPEIDKSVMLKTQEKINEVWNWQTIWGWDIPMAAMNATFLDRPEKAIEFLLMDTPKNTYLQNGHNYQDAVLPLYLPGNGGLLSAIALMCTYRNTEGNNGFPDDGQWNVKYENINNWVR